MDVSHSKSLGLKREDIHLTSENSKTERIEVICEGSMDAEIIEI